MTNAERIQANNAELREAIGIAESLPDAEGETMVGLWELNEELDLHDFDFYFNFKLPRFRDELFTNLFVDSGDLYCANDEVESTMYIYGSGWVGQEYRLMHLAEEPEDAEAKAWVKANARKLTYDECYEYGYEDGFAEGEKALLSTFVDWSVSTTSNSCIVEFYNNCDFYAHINLNVHEQTQGEKYHESFVLAPYEEYYISEGDMGWQDLSGGEWYVTVTIIGFSKDGEL